MTTRTISTSSSNTETENEVFVSKGTNSVYTKVFPSMPKLMGRPALYAVKRTDNTNGLKGTGLNLKEGISRPALRTTNRTISNETKNEKVQFLKPTTKNVPKIETIVPIKNEVVAAPNVVVPKSPGVVPMDISASAATVSSSDVETLTTAFSSQVLNVDIEDVDKGETNPALVSDYVNEIYDYMHELENSYTVRPNYLEARPITSRMRSILVDWLVQVAVRFELFPETLYLAVNTLDRFLQDRNVAKDKLQLIGVTSLFIASKYEEMYSPSINDFSIITDNAYTIQEIRKTEVLILKQLEFQLNSPLPLHFLRRNSKAGFVDAKTHTLAKYIAELTMVEYEMLKYKPSLIAAGSLYLSMMLLKMPWTKTLAYYSKYTEEKLQPIASKLAAIVLKAEKSKFQAVRTKFSSSKLMRISLLDVLKGDRIKDVAAAANAEVS